MPPNSPAAQFVKDTTGSLQGFCKLLKLPSITMSRYIKGDTLSMPSELREALGDAGFPFIEELAEAHMMWS